MIANVTLSGAECAKHVQSMCSKENGFVDAGECKSSDSIVRCLDGYHGLMTLSTPTSKNNFAQRQSLRDHFFSTLIHRKGIALPMLSLIGTMQGRPYACPCNETLRNVGRASRRYMMEMCQ